MRLAMQSDLGIALNGSAKKLNVTDPPIIICCVSLQFASATEPLPVALVMLFRLFTAP
jgi:hypothetical protein